jgi:hypothetical protein
MSAATAAAVVEPMETSAPALAPAPDPTPVPASAPVPVPSSTPAPAPLPAPASDTAIVTDAAPEVEGAEAAAAPGANAVAATDTTPTPDTTLDKETEAEAAAEAGSGQAGSEHTPDTKDASPVLDTDGIEMHFMHPNEGTPAAMALKANAGLKVSKFDKGLRKIRGIKHPKIKKFKRKKDGRKFSRNFKGKTIEGIHEQYTLTIGMMLGIRVAVSHPVPVASACVFAIVVAVAIDFDVTMCTCYFSSFYLFMF